MIFVTGDTHADFKRRFNTENFPEQKEMTKDDYVIICGDFGGIWDYEGESSYETWWLNWFESRNYTLLFIDGNHENFDRLNIYPEKQWHGGWAHEIRPHVLHLMRGQVFEIDGKRIFTFGGASSHDIQGGILDPDDPYFYEKRKRLSHGFLPYRINHYSWWKEELPSQEEMDEGLKNLDKHNNCVDFIVTHCCATSTQEQLVFRKREPNLLTDYLETIRQNVTFQKWYFGHYHDNITINERETLVYKKIIRVL